MDTCYFMLNSTLDSHDGIEKVIFYQRLSIYLHVSVWICVSMFVHMYASLSMYLSFAKFLPVFNDNDQWKVIELENIQKNNFQFISPLNNLNEKNSYLRQLSIKMMLISLIYIYIYIYIYVYIYIYISTHLMTEDMKFELCVITSSSLYNCLYIVILLCILRIEHYKDFVVWRWLWY